MLRIKINDKNDERLSIFYLTNERQLLHYNEPEAGLFIAESELVIRRALAASFVPTMFLIVEGSYDQYIDLFSICPEDIVVYEASDEIFRSLKGFILIKGILAVFKRKEENDIYEVCHKAKRIVVLEEVVNPTNVGAIFRNAQALFADGLLLTGDACDPLYRRSIRVSMGNVFGAKWARVDKNTYMDILHELGFKTVAFALKDNSVDIDDERLNKEEKLAIIMGSEGYGLSEETLKKSDYIVKINMNKEVDSLNVASASGIALWQLCKNNHH